MFHWSVSLRRLSTALFWGLLVLAFLASLAIAITSCATGGTHPQPQPGPVFDRPVAEATCRAIWTERCASTAIPGPVFTACVEHLRTNLLLDEVRNKVSQTPECVAVHQPTTGPKVVRGRPVPSGMTWTYPDGAKFNWRGVTAFGLLEHVAHGREAQAVAWMKAVRATGTKVVRVLAMNHGTVQWQNLPPQDGRNALPRLLALANEADLYVEIVALAGTKDRTRAFLEEQVKVIGAICARSANCLLEIANEPYHGSQHSSLVLPSTAKRLRALVPASLPTAYGAPRTDEPLTATDKKIEGRRDDGTLYCGVGEYVTLHRKRNADIWDDQRRFTELQKVQKECKKPVIDNEPYGFAESPKVGTNSRRTEVSAAVGQGLLSRLFEIGSNFHCEDCITTSPLRPKQLAALKAFNESASSIPDAPTFRFVNGKAPDSAVKDASFIGPSCGGCAVMRGFSFFAPGYNRFAWVGLKAGRDPAGKWQGGWKPGRVVNEVPGLRVLELTR